MEVEGVGWYKTLWLWGNTRHLGYRQALLSPPLVLANGRWWPREHTISKEWRKGSLIYQHLFKEDQHILICDFLQHLACTRNIHIGSRRIPMRHTGFFLLLLYPHAGESLQLSERNRNQAQHNLISQLPIPVITLNHICCPKTNARHSTLIAFYIWHSHTCTAQRKHNWFGSSSDTKRPYIVVYGPTKYALVGKLLKLHRPETKFSAGPPSGR